MNVDFLLQAFPFLLMSISSPGSMRSDKLFVDARSQEHTPLRVSIPVPMSEEDLDAGRCASTEVDLFMEGCGPTAKDLDEDLDGVFHIPPFFQGRRRRILVVRRKSGFGAQRIRETYG